MSAIAQFRMKRGEDWRSPQDFVIYDAGEPVDLTSEEWSVFAHVRQDESSEDYIEFDFDQEKLSMSVVSLLLPREKSAQLSLGTHVADVRIDGPIVRRYSPTFTLQVDADITR